MVGPASASKPQYTTPTFVDVAALPAYPIEAAPKPQVRHFYYTERKVVRHVRLSGRSSAPVMESTNKDQIHHFSIPAALFTVENEALAWKDRGALPKAPEEGFSILSDYVYSETVPDVKPADLIKIALRYTPEGSPRQEVKLVSLALGLQVGLMNAVAHIESDFDPRERTGSYIGLYQLSQYEFGRYGPTEGSILDARDNAIAAAVEIEYVGALFKMNTHRIPSDADLYLIHQQGLQGAAAHLADPARPAWKSMCATDEGQEKGVYWCKRAIWDNTLPSVKHEWRSVDSLTSGAFVKMWADRVALFLNHGA